MICVALVLSTESVVFDQSGRSLLEIAIKKGIKNRMGGKGIIRVVCVTK